MKSGHLFHLRVNIPYTYINSENKPSTTIDSFPISEFKQIIDREAKWSLFDLSVSTLTVLKLRRLFQRD